MELGIYLLRRIVHSIIVIIGLSLVIFVIARIVPGDPARMALGPTAPEEVVQRLREEMHLDKSIHVQYYYWIRGVLSGDFGRSLTTYRPVTEDIKEYYPATLELAIFAALIMIIFAILLGTISARFRDSWIDNLIRTISYFMISIPAFVSAIVFMLIFGYFWPILPVLGRLSPGVPKPMNITGLLIIDSIIHGDIKIFCNALKHLVLPTFALSIPHIFQNARITRSSMIENMRKDFLLSEQGYGIPERVIWFKYLLKPSLIPTVSMMGLGFGNLVANAFLVEQIFNWPGISRYGLRAMLSKDLNAISAVIIVFGATFLIANIFVDIVTSFLDPRIKFSKGMVE